MRLIAGVMHLVSMVKAGKVTECGNEACGETKARRIYGLLEGQFRSYFEKAERMKGITGENLLVLLERRSTRCVPFGSRLTANQA